MVIGENVAAGINDHARAHSIHTARGFDTAGRRGGPGNGLLAAYAYHGRLGRLVNLHDRRLSGIRCLG